MAGVAFGACVADEAGLRGALGQFAGEFGLEVVLAKVIPRHPQVCVDEGSSITKVLNGRIATLATTLATFGLTYFLTSEETPPAQASKGTWSVQPSISMTPAGWRNEGMAFGPSMVGRF